MMKPILSLCFVLTGLLSQGQGTSSVNAIKESISRYDQGWDAKNVDLVLQDYADNIDWTNAFGDRTQGKAELRTLLETIFSLDFVMSGQNNYQDPDITFPKPDLAIARSVNIRSGQKWPDGKPMKDRINNHIRVFQKLKGEWKIIHHIVSQAHDKQGNSQAEINKEIARNFYQDLWFSRNTDKYSDYFANEYVVCDVGEPESATESAIAQKEIADFFWANGEMSGEIDYQVANGNKVATRWYWTYEPTSLLGWFLVGDVTIPIVNIFHFENGKVVRTDNHRHDISTNRTNQFVIKGLLIGLLIALFPTIIAFRLRRKLKKLTT